MGKELITTLEALDLRILNGRFSPAHNFTSIYPRGMSVVDYIIVPRKSFKLFSNFRVHDPLGIATENNTDIDSSIPDHRILLTDLDIKTHTTRKKHNLMGKT